MPPSKNIAIYLLTLFFLFGFLFILTDKVYPFGPFPVKGEMIDDKGVEVGEAHVYPQYVEIFDLKNQMIGKVGIMVEKGLAKLFLVRKDNSMRLAGYAHGGKIYDVNDQLKGHFVWTPTWSFIYWPNGKRAGKVKCIAWPRVCAAGVGGYFLNIYKGESNEIGTK